MLDAKDIAQIQKMIDIGNRKTLDAIKITGDGIVCKVSGSRGIFAINVKNGISQTYTVTCADSVMTITPQ